MDETVKTFIPLIDKALEELEEWKTKGSDRSYFDERYLDYFRIELEKTKKCRSLSEMDLVVRTITHMIIDSGPMSENFMPSFQKILIAFQKLRKKRKVI